MSDGQPEVKIRIIKKKGGHAGAHGGAWKIAFADLMTAMMAFFLLMWLLGTANANTKAGIAGYMREGMEFFNTEKGKAVLDSYGKGILPGGSGMAPGPDGQGGSDVQPEDIVQKEKAAMEDTAKAIEQAFANDKVLQAFQDQVSMDFTEEGLRIQIADKAAQVLFDSGSAQLKSHTLSILKEIAAELGKLPNHVVIGGHTDSVQYASGAGYTNWELSADRANAARRVMESRGLRPDQVRRVTGYADSVPLEGKDPKDPQNRRISIIVLNSASDRAETARSKSRGSHSRGEGKEESEDKPAKKEH